jgi:hypothetical protein
LLEIAPKVVRPFSNIFCFRPSGMGQGFGVAAEFAYESIMRFLGLIICKADWIVSREQESSS